MFVPNVLLASPTLEAAQASDNLRVDRAELVAIFLEALFYGVEALTFVATIYLLHGAKRTPSFLLKSSVVVMMFMLNTIHLGSSLRRILNAFVGTPLDPVPDAVGYLSDLAGFLYRFSNILILIQTVILDILVTYRCFLIWDKKFWIPILPAVGILAFIVTGTIAIHAFATFTSDTLFTGTIHTWVSASLCITLITKLICLVLILLGTLIPRPGSVWHASYLKVNCNPRLYKAVLISIESGSLAILGALILVPVYLAGRNAQSILWDALSPLTGLALLLIISFSLLGITPTSSGTFRRRKNGPFPNSQSSVPGICSSSPISPTSRFSGSMFGSPTDKHTLPFSSGKRGTLIDYSSKHTTMEPAIAHVYPARNSFGGTILVAREADNTSSASSTSLETQRVRDALAYGNRDADRDVESARSWRGGVDMGHVDDCIEISSRRISGEAVHLGQSADGSVEVLQKVHVAS